MNTTELWYIVKRHSNMRVHNRASEVSLFDDYDAASERAARLSTDPTQWFVPIRVSEYHEIYEQNYANIRGLEE